MVKNKTIKLFLILGVILFSLFGVVGCTNPTGSDNINATYIRTSVEIGEGNNQFKVVNNHSDLVTLLKNNTPKKYNEDFFKTKSLLVFKIFEESGGNRSEIESYEIIDKTLNVYVKTKKYKDTADIRHWWFILELDKDEVNTVEYISIFKNDEKIMSNSYRNLSKEAIQCYFDKYMKDKSYGKTIEDVLVYKYLGTYCDSFVAIFNPASYSVSHPCFIEDLDFTSEAGGYILVYNRGEIIPLLPAYYIEKLLSYDDLVQIHNNWRSHRGKC